MKEQKPNYLKRNLTSLIEAGIIHNISWTYRNVLLITLQIQKVGQFGGFREQNLYITAVLIKQSTNIADPIQHIHIVILNIIINI